MDLLIAEAKAVVASHEQRVRDGDLDGILENIAEDVVVLTEAAPLIVGRQAFRDFYASLLDMGVWDFGHEYHGADVVGDLVFLHGVANGRHTPSEGGTSAFANNFVHVLRREEDGKLRIWRAAFASSGAESRG